MCVCVFVCMCLCVCVCVRERDREKKREKMSERDICPKFVHQILAQYFPPIGSHSQSKK